MIFEAGGTCVYCINFALKSKIKLRWMKHVTCNGEMKNTRKILVGESERITHLKKSSYKREVDIKMHQK
jgi:hypothetical protein